MKILYHHRTLGDGAEGIHVAEMVNAFRRDGHAVKVLSVVGEQEKRASARRQAIAAVRRWLPPALYEVGEIAYNVAGYRSVGEAIQAFKPDLVYDRYISFNYSVVAAARRAGVPVFLEVNAPYAYQRKTFERLCFQRLAQAIETKTCSEASRVVVVSTPLKRHLVALGVTETRISVIPNGVNLELFSPAVDGRAVRQRYELDQKLILGFTGSLRLWHGLPVLIQAVSSLVRTWPEIHLMIVGEGPEQAALRRRVDDLGGTSHVTFVGRVSHSEVASYIAACDIAVSPHAAFYQSPMKIVEYMAMAKPVVAPDLENIRDLIEHGREGWLFQPEQPSALEAALRTVVHDRDLRQQLGAGARARVVARHTWAHNARTVLSLLKS